MKAITYIKKVVKRVNQSKRFKTSLNKNHASLSSNGPITVLTGPLLVAVAHVPLTLQGAQPPNRDSLAPGGRLGPVFS